MNAVPGPSATGDLGFRPADRHTHGMVRRLLALLLSSAGKPISADALAEELWHGEPPRSARKTLQVYMHRLRRLFGDHARVTYDMAGYTLRVAPHELDASVFADLFAQAVQARERGDLEAAHSLLERAHELWHGDAYAGFQDMALIAAEADRLREAKLAALEEHFAIGLDLGRHTTLVGELSVVVANNPYRERLRGQLMIALYRGGRQAEALQAYRQGRELLVADLGVEPMPELQLLHRRILANDPELAAPAWLRKRQRITTCPATCPGSPAASTTCAGSTRPRPTATRPSSSTPSPARPAWARPRWRALGAQRHGPLPRRPALRRTCAGYDHAGRRCPRWTP